jgi:hypothetical protein
MTDVEEVSLRPLALRPLATAAGNPFASFGKGAGFGIKANKVGAGPAASARAAPPALRAAGAHPLPAAPPQPQSAAAAAAAAADENDKKPTGPKIRYPKEFLLKFMEVRGCQGGVGGAGRAPGRAGPARDRWRARAADTARPPRSRRLARRRAADLLLGSLASL